MGWMSMTGILIILASGIVTYVSLDYIFLLGVLLGFALCLYDVVGDVGFGLNCKYCNEKINLLFAIVPPFYMCGLCYDARRTIQEERRQKEYLKGVTIREEMFRKDVRRK